MFHLLLYAYAFLKSCGKREKKGLPCKGRHPKKGGGGVGGCGVKGREKQFKKLLVINQKSPLSIFFQRADTRIFFANGENCLLISNFNLHIFITDTHLTRNTSNSETQYHR